MLTANPEPGILLALIVPDFGAILWRDEDQAWAESEGFYLDEEDGKLCRDDDGPAGASFSAVFNHIRHLATTGDERAIRAMIFETESAKLAWVNRLAELGEQ